MPTTTGRETRSSGGGLLLTGEDIRPDGGSPAVLETPQGPTPPRAPVASTLGPPAALAALEVRMAIELMAYLAYSALPFLMRRGDGHPVMVLPSFAAGAASTVPLRWVLAGQGYSVHGWGEAADRDRAARTVEDLPRRLLALHDRHGARVSLVGHRDGGNWARDLARQHPFAVRQVITLGTPFRLRPGDAFAAERRTGPQPGDHDSRVSSRWTDVGEEPPLPVPVTSIYSRADGVAPWQAGLEAGGPGRENVEVVTGDRGLDHSLPAWFVVTDRLAQRDGSWRPFCPPPFTGHVFPTPADWQPGCHRS